MLRRINTILILFIFTFGFHTEGLGQSPSEYALIQLPVQENPLIWKFTKSEALQEFGFQMFINPLSTSQSYVMQEGYVLLSGMAFELDHGWNRMIFSECLDDWIGGYGTRGSGTGQFRWPKGLDCEAICNDTIFSDYYYIFIADASNDRIVKLRYNWRFEYQTIINDGAITGNGLFLPEDLDINNGFDFYRVTNDYLWVLNGNSQVKRFTFDGVLRNTYGSYGEGQGHFRHPTSVVSGRSYYLYPPVGEPHANTNYFFIADKGNNRIVWLYNKPGEENVMWVDEVYIDADIVDLEADNFGHIWAVDRANGRIIKYLPDNTLGLFPLCTFGSSGFGENQFYKPVSFSNTGGYHGCGNVYVVESWTDSSGGQYFVMGTDIVDFIVSSDDSHHVHFADFVLIDPAGFYFKVYDESDSLIRTIKAGFVYFAGPTTETWNGKDTEGEYFPSGNYLLQVSAVSVYADISEPGQPHADSVTKEGWVCHVHPDDIIGDVNGDGQVATGDEVYLINYLYKGGPPPDPLWKGDANGDCQVSLSDIVYLISYLYKGGPPPVLNFSCSPPWNCQP